ncbi:deoxyguanosinetriphosphate triphosphohydrolase [Corynebacterium sp. zg254]|uniref:Deoxyguanosinetriphosphate triphosphohydrolase-like protein n=1 Tax=Corynebacterium zhongnanshanii TaxID=2768834 RepID=A0ABQ6VDY5_9CORY|nr:MULTISPECIES: deoxyguanosinetriphosphate triphosphohydrolase [Corynebacterium]KAB3520892.1 deoxyguanosinetriphosphate triphosphohydrolase [Corynebacterium zhongnanshanii]MCR5914521.1 deoxyguanosinetriphosphate triphosphohydrolase [Corynebacterium sp. zg254]
MPEAYVYSEADLERVFATTPKELGIPGALPDGRDDFDRDRARVLHSAALRRLADKTQVVGPGSGDTPRTRLTHSLEVGQIARGIGKTLGADPDLCELAGLSHDIGHPPYGHNGERALDDAARELGKVQSGFEGNAQTLRILTRLEPKVLGEDGHSYGLNLTRASVDAACKYPWGPVADDGRRRKKYSCYEDDLDVLAWARQGADGTKKCLEAQIMDWSDDVAYSVHDVEDGIVSGRINLDVLWDLVELAALAEKGARVFGGTPEELVEAAGRLREMRLISRAADFHASLSDLAALKAMTSELVSRFVTACVTATRERYGAALGRYKAQLVIPKDVEAEVTLLKSIAVLYVMDEQEHLAQQERQRDRIFRVTDYLWKGGEGALDPHFRQWFTQAADDQAAFRVVIDQVASLTESRLERLDRQAFSFSASWA